MELKILIWPFNLVLHADQESTYLIIIPTLSAGLVIAHVMIVDTKINILGPENWSISSWRAVIGW